MALMRARESTMRMFRPALVEHGLTEQQWRVLRALSERPDGLEIGDLADVTYLLGPSLSRILVNLEHRGLVARSKVEHDARRSKMSLAEPGFALVRTIAPVSERAYRSIEDRFGVDRLAELLNLLDDLALITSIELHEEPVS